MESINEDEIKRKKKRGEVREDGRVFWRYKSDGREVWVAPEKVDEVRAKERSGAAACAKRRRETKLSPTSERIKRGFVRTDGMIFWAYSPDGSEQWMNECQLAEKREKSKQAKKKHYSNNKESELARAKKWREDNPEKAAKSFASSRTKFREKRIEQTKEWRIKNADHIKEYAKKYCAEKAHIRRATVNKRYAEDDVFQLRCRLRSRTVIAFRQKGFSKDSKSADMLGCSWEELKAHIEKQFARGMCWERFDEIEIDHIIPVASAKTKKELIPLFHFSNLRPLWKWENREKRDKMPY